MLYQLVPMLLADESIVIPTRANQITDLGKAIGGLINVLFIIAALATFLYLVLGGIQWITSGGDSKKTEAAGKQITNALIGLVIVAVSWAIMKLVGTVFGIDVFNLKIPVLF